MLTGGSCPTTRRSRTSARTTVGPPSAAPLRGALPRDGAFSPARASPSTGASSAVNNRDRNFTHAKIARRVAQIEERSRATAAARQRRPAGAERGDHHQTSAQRRRSAGFVRRWAVAALDGLIRQSPDQQVSLTDPDARSMAPSGRGSGVVGYNVQVAVETEHHLIVTHAVTNVGNDRAQLAPMAKAAQETLGAEGLHVVADRGYFDGEQVKACMDGGTEPSPCPSRRPRGEDRGPLRQADFVYHPTRTPTAARPALRCPTTSATSRGHGAATLRSTGACLDDKIKRQCTNLKERRITRWMQCRHLDREVQIASTQSRPDAGAAQRRSSIPSDTIKARMGASIS